MRTSTPAPSSGERGTIDRRDVLRALAGVLLLLPVAHLLAVAHEWLYFPWAVIEELAHEGPLDGFYGAPILRHTFGFLFELLAVGTLVAWLRRRLGVSWLRAAGDGALHLLPLGLTAFVLFVDDPTTRLVLFATVIAGTTAAIVLRTVPSPGPLEGESSWPRRLAPAVAVSAATWFITMALLRHASYWSSIIDLGLFSGALRSTIHGDGFLYAPELGVTFLAEHFSPILVLLLPVYALFEDPTTLLVVQSLAVAGGGYLLYVWAEETLGNGWPALAVMVGYLVAPDTIQSQWHDFHMDLLMPPMIFGALLALRRGSTVWFAICVAALWLTKEDAFLYTALLGLYAGAAHRRRLLALVTVCASLFVGYALLEWVLPAFCEMQDPGLFFTTTDKVGPGYRFLERYEHLGGSITDILETVAINPFYVVGHLFSAERLASLLTITAPLGFAAFFGLAPLLLLSAGAVMLLASHFLMSSLSFYYGAIPLAFATAAGVVGLARVSDRLAALDAAGGVPRLPRFHAAAVAWIGAAALTLLAIHPDSIVSPAYPRPRYLRTARTAFLDKIVDSIPSEAPLTTTGYIGVHLMNRPRPRMLPFGLDKAEWIVIDLFRPPWPLDGYQLWFFTERMLLDPGWGAVRAGHGVIVLKKGADRSLNDAALRTLRDFDLEPEEWEYSQYPNLAVARDDASGGYALTVTPDDRRGPGLLFWGPFAVLPPGEYSVEYRLTAEIEPGRTVDDLVASIDVFRDEEILAARDLAFRDFPQPGVWLPVELRFHTTEPGPYEFRVYYHDAGTLALDVVRVRRVGD